MRVTAIAIADGTRRWDVEVDAEDRSPEGLVYASGRLYLAIWGTLFVLDATTGETLFDLGQ